MQFKKKVCRAHAKRLAGISWPLGSGLATLALNRSPSWKDPNLTQRPAWMPARRNVGML